MAIYVLEVVLVPISLREAATTAARRIIKL